MKFSIVLLFSSFVTATAFGPTSLNNKAVVSKKILDVPANPLTQEGKQQLVAANSPLFRDVARTRGGAVPGWAAYNKALDTNPLTAKAFTSLVGWALGDILAQVFISGGPFDMKRFLTLSFFGLIYHGYVQDA
jgi:hypothetical protein